MANYDYNRTNSLGTEAQIKALTAEILAQRREKDAYDLQSLLTEKTHTYSMGDYYGLGKDKLAYSPAAYANYYNNTTLNSTKSSAPTPPKTVLITKSMALSGDEFEGIRGSALGVAMLRNRLIVENGNFSEMTTWLKENCECLWYIDGTSYSARVYIEEEAETIKFRMNFEGDVIA